MASSNKMLNHSFCFTDLLPNTFCTEYCLPAYLKWKISLGIHNKHLLAVFYNRTNFLRKLPGMLTFISSPVLQLLKTSCALTQLFCIICLFRSFVVCLCCCVMAQAVAVVADEVGKIFNSTIPI